MLLKLLQPSNACLCILVTLSKIFVFSQPLINLFVFEILKMKMDCLFLESGNVKMESLLN